MFNEVGLPGLGEVVLADCPECGAKVSQVKDADFEENGIYYYFTLNKELAGIIKEFNVPFVCHTCGNIKFSHRCIRDVVALWVMPKVEKVGSIYIPDDHFVGGNPADRYKKAIGVVLSVGPGHTDKRRGLIPNTEIAVGDVVQYEKSVPWIWEIADDKGLKHKVVFCGVQDIYMRY